MDVYLDQLSRVVKVHALRFLRYVVTDGAYSKQKFVAGVRGLESIRLASCEPMPICAISIRGPNAQGQDAKRPTMARSTGAPYRALSASIPKTSTSCCTIRFSTTCSCSAISRW